MFTKPTTTAHVRPFKTLISDNKDGSSLYCARWSELLSYPIINWKYNRPADEVRIPEIRSQLLCQEYVDGVIYLANDNGTLVCYDGIHRIQGLNSIYVNPLFKTMAPDHKMFIHYYPEYDERKIRQKFETLNKCIPVPNIYSDAEKKLDCMEKVQGVVEYFTEKYKPMFKPSKNPNIPHVNRDVFTNHVETIIMELGLSSFNVVKIIKLFEDYNRLNEIDRNISKKLTCKQLTKCYQYNCFVFADKHWYIKIIKAFMNSKIVLHRNI
jgi:hypothetical protein